jgi:hypothetical protein
MSFLVAMLSWRPGATHWGGYYYNCVGELRTQGRVLSLLLASKSFTDLNMQPCITCTCTDVGPQNFCRKFNVCAHNNWGVAIEVSMSVDHAPWCVVRT